MSQGLIILVVVAVIAIAALAHHQALQRRKTLAAWATAHGLRFDYHKDRDMDDRFRDFQCLRQGSSRYAYNIVHGFWQGREMLAFDYHYETGSGKNRSSHHFSAVILASPIPLKSLLIRREGFFDKIGELFGFDDIDFESAEFSRKYCVRSPDRKWAFDVVHPGMMEYLMNGPAYSLRFGPGHVIAWNGRRFKPMEFETAVDFVHGVIVRIPDYVKESHNLTS